MATILSHIWEKMRLQWKERNTILHGETKDDQAKQAEKLVNEELAILYAIQTKVQHRERELFRSTLQVHQNEPLRRKQNWLSIHLKNIQQSAKNFKKSGLQQVKDIRKWMTQKLS